MQGGSSAGREAPYEGSGLQSNNSAKAPFQVRARLNEVDALRERAKGKSYEKVGEALGLSKNGARKAILRGLEILKTEREDIVVEYAGVQLERMRLALEAIMPRVEAGDLDAIETMLKIETRTARLLALDAPAKYPEDADGRPILPGVTVNIAQSLDGLSEAQLEALRLIGVGGSVIEHEGSYSSADSGRGGEGLGTEESPALYDKD